MSDYAEFIAGTNPTKRRFQTGLRLRHGPEQPLRPTPMAAIPGRAYQLQTLNQQCFMDATDRLASGLRAAQCPMPQPNVGSDHNAHL